MSRISAVSEFIAQACTRRKRVDHTRGHGLQNAGCRVSRSGRGYEDKGRGKEREVSMVRNKTRTLVHGRQEG